MIEEDFDPTKPTKISWQQFRYNNQQVILQSQIQIEAAKKVIELCDAKIAEFPEEEVEEEKVPVGVN